MIVAQVDLGKDYHTQVTGDNINEVIEKIKEYHTMSEFERKFIIEKDGSKGLDKAVATGWYLAE